MRLRSFALGVAIAAGACAGCEEASEKAGRIVREEVNRTIEKTGDTIEEKADTFRESATDKFAEKVNGGEKEAPADAELRKEAKGKPEPSTKPEEDDPTK